MTDTDHSVSDGRADPAGIGYADAMAELDDILAELDDDAIDIDVLSERVERAAALIALCRGRIATAQSKVAGIVEALDVAPGDSED